MSFLQSWTIALMLSVSLSLFGEMHLRLSDTLGGILIDEIVLAAAPNKAKLRFFLPYCFGYGTETDTALQKEVYFFPSGQSMNDWSECITLIYFPHMIDLQEYKRNLSTFYSPFHANIKTDISRNSKGEYFYLRVNYTDTKLTNQYRKMVAINGQKGCWVVTYTARYLNNASRSYKEDLQRRVDHYMEEVAPTQYFYW